MNRLVPLVVALVAVGLARGAFAKTEGPPDVEEIADGDFLIDPPALEAPNIRTPRLRTEVYTDFTVGRSPDLKALAIVTGSATNYRLAVGGRLRLADWQLNFEFPFWQKTAVDFTSTPTGGSLGNQSASGFGDARFGVTYAHAIDYYPPKMLIGGTVQGRFSTQDQTFTFTSPSGDFLFQFPHYWHVEASVLFATAIGRWSFVVNQGALALLAKDVTYELLPGVTQTQVYPEMYFYDAHYAAAYYLLPDLLGVSLELNTTFELSSQQDQPQLNGIHAVYLSPGVQVYAAGFKIDLAGRWGLTKGADPFGVMSFSGSKSAMLRLTRSFDFDAARPAGN